MQPLHGSLVALVTPMHSNGDIDFGALENLIEWHIESGTNGIVSVGTTGESSTLSVVEHLEVIEKTINTVNGRIPVIAGTGANSTHEAIELTKSALTLGADYALIVTPYYNKPNQEGLYQHFQRIADRVDIPQIIYNVPSRTACDVVPDTVMRLSNHENIVGIKEALDSPERMSKLIKLSERLSSKKNFSILSGDDHTFNFFMAIGAHGVISVAANVIPKDISEICSLNFLKEFDEAKLLNSKFKNLYQLLFIESNPMPVKWILSEMRKIQPGIRLPLITFKEDFHKQTKDEMIKLQLI
ncbi:MAG: 4-hydroxy-tetrahydrodipicolinate synthase [Gammaproteobacteria bacterium]|nr:4-hydroxy-tetrahydrodipicolinate synthase [Gammaproteobacteria bacterium]